MNELRPFVINGTSKTPTVLFDAVRGIVEIKGRSHVTMLSSPTSAADFYNPLVEWLEKYSKNPPMKTEVTVQMESYDTSCAQYLMLIFKKLEPIIKQGYEIMVYWYYISDDEDLLECGEDYKAIIRLPFCFIPY